MRSCIRLVIFSPIHKNINHFIESARITSSSKYDSSLIRNFGALKIIISIFNHIFIYFFKRNVLKISSIKLNIYSPTGIIKRRN